MSIMKYLRRFYHRYIQTVLYEFETVTIRLILATASLFFGTALLSSNIPFSKEAYSIMAAVGDQWVWGPVFMTHFFLTMWRLHDPKSRPKCAVAVNALGVFLWGFSTLSINVAVGYFAPSTAMEWVMVVLASWALFRTAKAPERVSP